MTTSKDDTSRGGWTNTGIPDDAWDRILAGSNTEVHGTITFYEPPKAGDIVELSNGKMVRLTTDRLPHGYYGATLDLDDDWDPVALGSAIRIHEHIILPRMSITIDESSEGTTDEAHDREDAEPSDDGDQRASAATEAEA